MGWLCYQEAPIDERAEIIRICTFANETRSIRPLMAVKNGRAWYLAVETTLHSAEESTGDFQVDLDGKYIFGVVILVSKGGGEWCYKDMDETMGPAESQAPAKLLDLLSPTTRPYALEWRERCRANAKLASRKLAHGDKIKLAQALEFGDGVTRDTFTVNKERLPYQKRTFTSFVCCDTGACCNISKFMQRDWSVI